MQTSQHHHPPAAFPVIASIIHQYLDFSLLCLSPYPASGTGTVQKMTFGHDYTIFLETLRQARIRAGMTQAELAGLIEETQSWVSACERGQRRLDVMELRAICTALGISLGEFIEQLETALRRQ